LRASVWSGLFAASLFVSGLSLAGTPDRVIPSGSGANPLLVYHDITFDTSPTGLLISLDGLDYLAPFTLTCEEGSLHFVNTPTPQSGGPGVRYVFEAWSDGGPQSHAISCDADATILAFFGTEYYLDIRATWGTTVPESGWYPAGTSVVIEYLPPVPGPSERVLFAGWVGTGVGSYTGIANPALIVMAGPITEIVTEVRQFRFVFDTSPAGVTIEVDGSLLPSPVTMWWTEGTSHSVWCVSPLDVGGNVSREFSHWDDGVTDNPRLFDAVSAPEQRTCFYERHILLASGRSVDRDIDPGNVANRSSRDPPLVVGSRGQESAGPRTVYARGERRTR